MKAKKPVLNYLIGQWKFLLKQKDPKEFLSDTSLSQ